MSFGIFFVLLQAKMKKNTSILRFFIALLTFTGVVCSNASSQSIRTLSTDIKTARMRWIDANSNEPLGGDPIRPFLILGNTDNRQGIGAEGDLNGHLIEVSFDEMSHEVRQFTYTVRHLNADGSESRLSSTEFLEGFTTKDITNYEHSLNTTQLYTHYSLTFPNEEMTITKSGNYRLIIYEDGDQDKRRVEADFCVVEPQVKILANVRPNTDIELNGRYQQLDIDLDFGKTTNIVLNTDIFIVVRQNGRYDNQVFAPRPTFIESNRLRYTNCRALIFEGGNEYRHFDTYSTYFAGVNVDRITHDNNDYHAILMTDALRGTGAMFAGERVLDKCGTAYMHEFDVNGQFIVNAERTIYDMDTEAEYMWVHWTLAAENPWFDGAVYVGGDIFGNQTSNANRMLYDSERKCYWLAALVKQGGVDYQYWFVPSEDKKTTLQRTEGSHWQTENEYTIYVYYRPFGSRYDQVVGLQVIK